MQQAGQVTAQLTGGGCGRPRGKGKPMNNDTPIYYLGTADDNYGDGADGVATAEAIEAAIRHTFPGVEVQIRRDDISCTWRAAQCAELLDGEVYQWVQANWTDYVVYRTDTGAVA